MTRVAAAPIKRQTALKDPVSWSNLKHILRSPAHYREQVLREWKETAAMRLGRVVDALIFKGPMPVVFSGKRRQGKEWDAFKEANEGRDILTEAEFSAALRIVDTILDNEDAMKVLKGRRHTELEFEYLGRRCCSHPDILAPYFITDLKTSADINPLSFPFHARRMGYHGQLAMYEIAAKATGEADPQNFYIVAAETKPPYPVVVYQLSEVFMEEGRKLVRTAMERLLACEATNEWPAYAQSVVMLDCGGDDIDFTFAEEEE